MQSFIQTSILCNWISDDDRLRLKPYKDTISFRVDVTINSDDILIFDSPVSKEYLKLYEAGTLTAEELDDIRINGLRKL